MVAYCSSDVISLDPTAKWKLGKLSIIIACDEDRRLDVLIG